MGVCGAWNIVLLSRDTAATAKKQCTCKKEHKRKKNMQEKKVATDMRWNSTNIVLMPGPKKPIETANNFGIPKHAIKNMSKPRCH